MRISDWSSDVCSSDLVAGVVPGQAALVMGVLPEVDHVLDRLKGLLAVDHDLLAALVDLRAAERPEVGVGEGRRVAEGMSHGRSEERSVGKEGVSTCRSRWSPYHQKKNKRT